jgi:glycosyltransferase involved in cell wall biosynthesis
MQEKKLKLIIATLFYNMQGYSPYIESMVTAARTITKAGLDFEYWAHSGDSYVDRARNTICSRFLRSDGDYLLFIDSDMEWEPDAIGKMLQSPYEVTGCAYPLKNNWNQWGVSIKRDPKDRPIIDSNGFVETWHVPAGFLLLSRSALEKMVEICKDDFYYDSSADPASDKPVKYYNIFKCDNDKTGEIRYRYGEDIYFCKKWTENGGKIWIRPDIEFGHIGTKEWVGKFQDFIDEQIQFTGLRINKKEPTI